MQSQSFESPRSPLTQQPSSPTYANMVQQEVVLTRYHAIILDALDGLTVEDYALAVASLVGAKNVSYISRMSHSRIVVYLKQRELVDELIDRKVQVTVKTQSVPIRPFVSRARRVLISNFPPFVPKSYILDEFSRLGISPVSQITSLKAAIRNPDLAHVLCMRKQVYLNPEDLEKMPDKLLFTYDGYTDFMYFTTDKPTCFLCHQDGHLAKSCSAMSVSKENQESAEEVCLGVDLQEATAVSSTHPTVPPSGQDAPLLPPSHKRPASNSSSITAGVVLEEASSVPNSKQLKKKLKTVDTIPVLEEVTSKTKHLQEFIDQNGDKFPLDYSSFVNFLVNSFGKNEEELKKLTSESSENVNKLLAMLTEIHALVPDRALKARLTRIKNKILDYSNSKNEDVFSLEHDFPQPTSN